MELTSWSLGCATSWTPTIETAGESQRLWGYGVISRGSETDSEAMAPEGGWKADWAQEGPSSGRKPEVWEPTPERNSNGIYPDAALPCHTSPTWPLLVTGLRSLPPCMIWIDPVKNSLKSTIKMIYSLILVAIDSESDLWLERGEEKKKILHLLGIQAKVSVLIEKHGWLGKSHIF